MNITVLGGGTWGVTLGVLLYEKGNAIKIWEFSKDKGELLRKNRYEPNLPWLFIPNEIDITDEFKVDCDLIISCLPSWAVREVFLKLKNLYKDQLIVSCTKGFEEETFLRPSDVIKEVIPQARTVVLSGPSHAEEVSRKIPTSVVSASHNEKDRVFTQRLFSNSYFRVYTNYDIIGVELGGGLKNIIAIAGGISDGLGFGDNTKAALLCRGMVEMIRLGVSLGGSKETFFGLSGMGDLIVTSFSKHSRNRRFGELLGKGHKKEDAQKEINMVIEGIKTTRAVYEYSLKSNTEMPITNEVYKIIFEEKEPGLACKELLERKLKEEDYGV
ncbi:TPA: glycerol-3-phosphate dehydrogenase [bacterium]|nr:glycerol-3-phosphate dehydrogenase [bacterium]